MKQLVSILNFIILLNIVHAQTALFNNGSTSTDSIAQWKIAVEYCKIFGADDTITILENRITRYDTNGNMVYREMTGPVIPKGSVQTRKYDLKNRMVEESWFFYPQIPIQKNSYLFYDGNDTSIMQVETIFYVDGNIDNTVKNISYYNKNKSLIEYKSFNNLDSLVLHEKYKLDAEGRRIAVESFHGRDSTVMIKDDENGLPFHDPVWHSNAGINMDTIRIDLDNGNNLVKIFEDDVRSGNKSLVKTLEYYPNGLLFEERKNNSVWQYRYEFY